MTLAALLSTYNSDIKLEPYLAESSLLEPDSLETYLTEVLPIKPESLDPYLSLKKSSEPESLEPYLTESSTYGTSTAKIVYDKELPHDFFEDFQIKDEFSEIETSLMSVDDEFGVEISLKECPPAGEKNMQKIILKDTKKEKHICKRELILILSKLIYWNKKWYFLDN